LKYDTGTVSERQGGPVERLCFTFEIRPGTEDEYKRRHDEIWPELVEAIKDAGIANYTLFRRGTTVVGYAECEPDVATSFGKVGQTEVNRRWAEWFEDVIVTLVDENGELFRLDEVWHLA
jgi:L-rhamnose mutarotase